MIYYTPVARSRAALLIFENWEMGNKENYNSYTRSGGGCPFVGGLRLARRFLRAGAHRLAAGALLSVYGRTKDALASGGEEGRGRLRESSGSRHRALIRGCPNGATRRSQRGDVGG